MIYKGERFMHITTYHIPAKRRHIDAATRLRRLSHVVAASTRVVRGCKLPRRPSARFSPHAGLRRPAFSVWAVDSSCPYPSSFGSLCGTSAGVKMGEMAFAELPRVSKWKKWPLRNFRKRQNGGNGLCGTSASVKVEEMAFAELPQASKWGKRPLRNFRKCQNGRNGPCGSSASVVVFIVTSDQTIKTTHLCQN